MQEILDADRNVVFEEVVSQSFYHATDGQSVGLPGLAPASYYLVSTANNAGVHIETDTSNNTARTRFALSRDNEGTPKIAETGPLTLHGRVERDEREPVTVEARTAGWPAGSGTRAAGWARS